MKDPGLTLLRNEIPIKRRLRFQSGLVTKTRLMGVIALKLHWIKGNGEHLVQWFLLDAEEHGIYDYISVTTDDLTKTDQYTQQFMGSLGGEKIPIGQGEAFYLIQKFAVYNKKYKKVLPKAGEYRFILNYKIPLNRNLARNVMAYISETVDNPIQLINLLLMRLVARDQEGINYLENGENRRKSASLNFGTGGALLKNITRPTNLAGVFKSESIVDVRGQYHLIHSIHEVKRQSGEYRMTAYRQVSKRRLSPESVAYAIQYPETLQLYKTKIEGSKPIEMLLRHMDNALKYEFAQGIMLVEFHSKNEHLYEEVYYIGRDLKGIYFLNHFQQLIFCTYRPQEEEQVRRLMEAPPFHSAVDKILQHEAPGSIIYEYAEGEVKDFLLYLEELE